VFAPVIGSAIGLSCYLRLIAAMATTEETAASSAAGGTLAALTLVLIWFGVYPTPLVHLLAATVAHLT
jgi:NADH:ubiquinone oxidoreductase subunit 2 (subunit N)